MAEPTNVIDPTITWTGGKSIKPPVDGRDLLGLVIRLDKNDGNLIVYYITILKSHFSILSNCLSFSLEVFPWLPCRPIKHVQNHMNYMAKMDLWVL